MIGPPAEPLLPSVIGGRSTIEVRWILRPALERGTGPECEAELTEIRSSGETWWSLGFEGHCQSYTEWLSRHRVTAAIHPRVGEESPVLRGHDQSRSLRERGTPWLT